MKILYLNSIEFGAKEKQIKNIKQINTQTNTKGVS